MQPKEACSLVKRVLIRTPQQQQQQHCPFSLPKARANGNLHMNWIELMTNYSTSIGHPVPAETFAIYNRRCLYSTTPDWAMGISAIICGDWDTTSQLYSILRPLPLCRPPSLLELLFRLPVNIVDEITRLENPVVSNGLQQAGSAAISLL